jgi:hypothetical protein
MYLLRYQEVIGIKYFEFEYSIVNFFYMILFELLLSAINRVFLFVYELDTLKLTSLWMCSRGHHRSFLIDFR